MESNRRSFVQKETNEGYTEISNSSRFIPELYSLALASRSLLRSRYLFISLFLSVIIALRGYHMYLFKQELKYNSIIGTRSSTAYIYVLARENRLSSVYNMRLMLTMLVIHEFSIACHTLINSEEDSEKLVAVNMWLACMACSLSRPFYQTFR